MTDSSKHKYRADIDGLRAIAVCSVILFHTGFSVFSGGYIGVDVFFVISGYLITGLISSEIANQKFTFINFYKRRATRLLPALYITLFLVLIFGFVFYTNKAFDRLGREIFFSSFGAANIFFAQGKSYFAQDEAFQPLIHLWSLGIEEQFYIIWPILLIFTHKYFKRYLVSFAICLLILSLCLSIQAVSNETTKAYFLLHYRAFELLVGAITSILLVKHATLIREHKLRQLFPVLGLTLIFIPLFLLDSSSSFPGLNALWPCLGTALIIAFPYNEIIKRTLSLKALTFLGLISYPLYLYHQPVITGLHFFNAAHNPYFTLVVTLLVSVPSAVLTYRYIETPLRSNLHPKTGEKRTISFLFLLAPIPIFAVLGIAIAKSQGFDTRFKYLNPFAFELSEIHSTTFSKHYKSGYNVSTSEHSTALFVGDSVMHQYVLPIQIAFELEQEEIDTVTRGGCVLLKGVEFQDKFADVSCNGIRESLYTNNKTYDYVVISQYWGIYDGSVTNFPLESTKENRWDSFIEKTIEHYLPLTDRIILVGENLEVDGLHDMQSTLNIQRETYLGKLENIQVKNKSKLKMNNPRFSQFTKNPKVTLLNPLEIFCEFTCKLHDGTWSYFRDHVHTTSAATPFVISRIRNLLAVDGNTSNH